MDLVYLEEDQNKTFDAEFHTPAAMAATVAALKARFPDGGFTALDLGGGNGRFADSILATFPAARITVLDVSDHLLNLNTKNDRKTLVRASIDEMASVFGSQKFDVIFVNFLLHHLVGPTRRACWNNCVSALRLSAKLISANGVISVAENIFTGPFGTNIPSNTIYAITKIKNQRFVRFSRRYFNTAGTGVCFRSHRSWESIMRKAGLGSEIIHWAPWPRQSRSKIMKMTALGQVGVPAHAHYICIQENI